MGLEGAEATGRRGCHCPAKGGAQSPREMETMQGLRVVFGGWDSAPGLRVTARCRDALKHPKGSSAVSLGSPFAC